jgi:hypothetical protein
VSLADFPTGVWLLGEEGRVGVVRKVVELDFLVAVLGLLAAEVGAFNLV